MTKPWQSICPRGYYEKAGNSNLLEGEGQAPPAAKMGLAEVGFDCRERSPLGSRPIKIENSVRRCNSKKVLTQRGPGDEVGGSSGPSRSAMGVHQGASYRFLNSSSVHEQQHVQDRKIREEESCSRMGPKEGMNRCKMRCTSKPTSQSNNGFSHDRVSPPAHFTATSPGSGR